MFLTKLKKDARYFQLVFQTTFLLYGIYSLHWQPEWWLYGTYFLTGIFTQFGCAILFSKQRIKLFSTDWWRSFNQSIPSVLISSYGLTLLLKTNDIYVAFLAAFVSILSKYIFRIKGKHIFNPSALGIVVAVYLTDKAWISPGQWGSGAMLAFTVLCLGFIITTKVQKLDVSLGFLGTFAALLFIRQVIYLGWPTDYFIQSLSTGSLVLFSFFMITDPKTTPDNAIARIVWSMGVAIVAFYLTAFKFMNGAPILVLVLAQPIVPLLDHLFKAKKFSWGRVGDRRPTTDHRPRMTEIGFA